MRTFVITLALLGGCGNKTSSPRDLGSTYDASDGAVATDDCVHLDTWPGASGTTYALFSHDSQGGMNDQAQIGSYYTNNPHSDGTYDVLFIAAYVPDDQPGHAYTGSLKFTTASAPQTFESFANSGTAICVLQIHFDPSTANGDNANLEVYAAQAGTMSISVDDSPSGVMSASGASLHFVQFTSAPPFTPVPNGKCYDIDSFIGSAMYANPDAGT